MMINIAERGMWTANRIDNGEEAQGYLFVSKFDYFGKTQIEYFIQTEFDMLNFGTELTTKSFLIDPTTLKPISAKVLRQEGCGAYYNYSCYCPNCKRILKHEHESHDWIKACWACGMVLDWSGEDE